MKNNKFKKLSAAHKRVAIAKDVLRLIKSQKLIMNSGAYILLQDGTEEFEAFNQAFFKNRKTRCEVCAAGAVVAAGIGLFNSKKIVGHVNESDMKNKWFSRDQMALVEAAFERGKITNIADAHGHPDGFDRACSFGEDFDGDKELAIAIFKNIIANKGTFKP